MRIVVALGGNALLTGKERPTLDAQKRNVDRAIASIVPLAERHTVILIHGNGPQVGLLAKAQESADADLRRPLDVLVAETQGMLGYLLCRAITRVVPALKATTVVTRVEVDPDDPAFRHPTKPIGARIDRDRARELTETYGWSFVDEGDQCRRVVASPEPRTVVESEAVMSLLGAGYLVVCGGGGGVPVAVGPRGRQRGIEAVIDKDRTAALLGIDLGADALLVLTDVDGLYRRFGEPDEELIERISVGEAKGLDLPEGSMAPKVEACARFVEGTGGFAAIGSLDAGEALLEGRAGTRIEADQS